MTTATAYWIWNEATMPCSCCSPVTALDDEGAYWVCGERAWAVLDRAPDMTKAHPIEFCDGNCGNRLHTKENIALANGLQEGLGWGDLELEWEREEWMQLDAAVKAEREASEARRRAEEERLRPLRELRRVQMDRLSRRAVAARCKGAPQNIHAPCRALYDWDRDTGHKTKYISTECWGHEFTDALTDELVDRATGQIKLEGQHLNIEASVRKGDAVIRKTRDGYMLVWTPHVCWMLHPGHEHWLPEWKDDYTFRAPRKAPQTPPAVKRQPAAHAPKKAPRAGWGVLSEE